MVKLHHPRGFIGSIYFRTILHFWFDYNQPCTPWVWHFSFCWLYLVNFFSAFITGKGEFRTFLFRGWYEYRVLIIVFLSLHRIIFLQGFQILLQNTFLTCDLFSNWPVLIYNGLLCIAFCLTKPGKPGCACDFWGAPLSWIGAMHLPGFYTLSIFLYWLECCAHPKSCSLECVCPPVSRIVTRNKFIRERSLEPVGITSPKGHMVQGQMSTGSR